VSGVAAFLRRGRSDSPVVEGMFGAAPHRGSVVETVDIGHARLGVCNDPDFPEATLSVDGDLAVVFTGQLDNLAELAKDLQRRGQAPRSMTPAGVLLAAFRADGATTPNRLRGVYSAVISDGRKLWCLRDHVGFETLFYREDENGVYVANEVKQVLRGSGLGGGPDLEIVESIFYAQDYDESLCAVDGVRRVQRATLLEADEHETRWRRYWEPESLLETARLSEEEVVERFDALMSQAAARALTGNDIIALSGGIDSPAVSAYAAPEHLKLSERPLSAYTAIYPDYPSADELVYTKDVAAQVGIPLDTYIPKPQRLDRLEHWVRLFDQPWPIWSPEGAVDRFTEARDRGFRNILTGEIAEELVGGSRHLAGHLLLHGRLRPLLRHIKSKRDRGTTVPSILRELAATFAPRWLVAARQSNNPRISVPSWMDDSPVRDRLAREAVPTLDRWRLFQVGVFTGVGISGEANQICQSYCGVRVRSPWADVDLWEFFLSLPAQTKQPGAQSKAMVRQLLRGKVPDSVLDRTDKTLMNDWFLAECVDYPSLRRWLTQPPHRVRGVDYDLLADELHRGDMNLSDYLWAKDLAVVHAFLALW
jgi:asparagine synthase (glutamine-hydrolysing)